MGGWVRVVWRHGDGGLNRYCPLPPTLPLQDPGVVMIPGRLPFGGERGLMGIHLVLGLLHQVVARYVRRYMRCAGMQVASPATYPEGAVCPLPDWFNPGLLGPGDVLRPLIELHTAGDYLESRPYVDTERVSDRRGGE